MSPTLSRHITSVLTFFGNHTGPLPRLSSAGLLWLRERRSDGRVLLPVLLAGFVHDRTPHNIELCRPGKRPIG